MTDIKHLAMAGGLLLSATIVPTLASAQEVIDVNRGKATTIYHIGVYGANCGSEPYAKITRMVAQNGTVSHKNGYATISKGVCKGKKIKTVAIIYKPNAGFKGRDTLSLAWSFPTYGTTAVQSARARQLTINVR